MTSTHIQFEWTIAPHPEESGFVHVYERVVGDDRSLRYTMPEHVAEGFIKARRSFVDRAMRSRGGVRLLLPPWLQ